MLLLIVILLFFTTNNYGLDFDTSISKIKITKSSLEKALIEYDKKAHLPKYDFNRFNKISVPINTTKYSITDTIYKKHTYNCKFKSIVIYTPFKALSQENFTFSANYKYEFNKKISFQILKFKHNISSKNNTYTTGIIISQPVNYRYHFKLPISSKHSFKLKFQEDMKKFYTSSTQSFNFDIVNTCSVKLNLKWIYNPASEYKLFKMESIFSFHIDIIQIQISYGMQKYSDIINLISKQYKVYISIQKPKNTCTLT